jgi:hypothetical protein
MSRASSMQEVTRNAYAVLAGRKETIWEHNIEGRIILKRILN